MRICVYLYIQFAAKHFLYIRLKCSSYVAYPTYDWDMHPSGMKTLGGTVEGAHAPQQACAALIPDVHQLLSWRDTCILLIMYRTTSRDVCGPLIHILCGGVGGRCVWCTCVTQAVAVRHIYSDTRTILIVEGRRMVHIQSTLPNTEGNGDWMELTGLYLDSRNHLLLLVRRTFVLDVELSRMNVKINLPLRARSCIILSPVSHQGSP